MVTTRLIPKSHDRVLYLPVVCIRTARSTMRLTQSILLVERLLDEV